MDTYFEDTMSAFFTIVLCTAILGTACRVGLEAERCCTYYYAHTSMVPTAVGTMVVGAVGTTPPPLSADPPCHVATLSRYVAMPCCSADAISRRLGWTGC